MKKPQFIIAAPSSNSGKTTITLGLLRALHNREVRVQPFKCGPDYIDPKFHELAAGLPSRNLDLFMMSNPEIKHCYAKQIREAEASCIEGVMGLFDGASKAKGSTADIAKSLDLPVILVVNAKSVAYSVAPLLYGFKNFDSDLKIAGVIFNHVNTASHYQFLKEACNDVGIAALGYLPHDVKFEIPSRHLGLSITLLSKYQHTIEEIAVQLEKTINIDLLLKLTVQDCPQVTNTTSTRENGNLRIAVARDEAFNFTYHQNLETLEAMGEVQFFSPIHDSRLPDADLVYLPGGYPECYLKQLSSNIKMHENIKSYADNCGVLIAECGGLMYLGQSIIDSEGYSFSMPGVFGFSTSMAHTKLSLGYRTLKLDTGLIQGHEFHYSTLINDEDTACVQNLFNARDQPVTTRIYRYKQVLASYVHFYFSTPEQVRQLLKLTINTLKHEDIHT